ncbi:MAG TPA: virulence factor [Bauldia sp.]|nr:virulence factor [Bauldia sp.]
MAELTIVYWRDIPAQVIARMGRRSAKVELSKRFMESIDAAAMRAGATGTDAYLADWRRGGAVSCADDLEAAARDAAASLESAYDNARLRRLVDAGGRDSAGE